MNNMQQGVQTRTLNMPCTNVGSCGLIILLPFARGHKRVKNTTPLIVLGLQNGGRDVM